MLLHVTDSNLGTIVTIKNHLIKKLNKTSPYSNCMMNPPVINKRYGIPGVIHVFGFVQYSSFSA